MKKAKWFISAIINTVLLTSCAPKKMTYSEYLRYKENGYKYPLPLDTGIIIAIIVAVAIVMVALIFTLGKRNSNKVIEIQTREDIITKVEKEKIQEPSNSSNAIKKEIENIKMLKELMDEGILTEEEFETKKKAILKL